MGFFSKDVNVTNGRCFIVFTAFMVVLVLPLTQLRYLHSLTIMNAVNITCMLIFVCISIYSLSTGEGVREGAETQLEPYWTGVGGSLALDKQHQNGPILGLELLWSAYFYQLIILEIMAEMKDPSEFPKANYWTTPIVLFAALGTGVSQYYFLGEDQVLLKVSVQDTLTSIFDDPKEGRGPLAYMAVICFGIHMIGCCVIKSIILTRSTQLLLNPKGSNKATWISRLQWAGISFVVLVLAWSLTLIINNVGIETLLTGLLAILMTTILPIVCYIICCKKRDMLSKVPAKEWILIGLILFIAVASIGECALILWLFSLN